VRVALVSSTIPFVKGGGRFIVEWLHEALTARGHQAETIWIPYVDYPHETLDQMLAFRLLRIDNADRVITFRPPAHLVQHSNKVVWFIHHLRHFYDLWGTPYRPNPDRAPYRALRDLVRKIDTGALQEARHLFTNSSIVADRLRRFNELSGEVLYPPVAKPERFRAGEYGNEIICICRMEHHKRQHLLIEAMHHVRTPVWLRLCGRSMNPNYVAGLRKAAEAIPGGRVLIEARWISEEEKADLLATALASAYVPFDEDSYGYPTLEAAHARRCTVTVADAGGVPELVLNDETGLVVEPHPEAVAAAFDRLFMERGTAARLGRAAEARIAALGISWDNVIERLLG
jgi:glycosyltransferase involved in cell wall biosynthesis